MQRFWHRLLATIRESLVVDESAIAASAVLDQELLVLVPQKCMIPREDLESFNFPTSLHAVTLQSKIALLAAGISRATARPIFTACSSDLGTIMRRSSNGCELLQGMRAAMGPGGFFVLPEVIVPFRNTWKMSDCVNACK